MNRRRQPFRTEEHLGAGMILHRMTEDIRSVAVAVSHSYGVGMSDKLLRVAKHLAKVRSELDSIVCREAGDRMIAGDIPVTKVYYGWEDGPTPVMAWPPVDERRWLASAAEAALPAARAKWKREAA